MAVKVKVALLRLTEEKSSVEGPVGWSWKGRECVCVKVRAMVTDSIIEDVDVVMRMDAINQLGSVTVRQGNVQFGSAKCLLTAHADTRDEKKRMSVIKDKDFRVEFDGTQWIVEWF